MTNFELAVLKRFGTRAKCEEFMRWGSGAVSKIAQGNRELKSSEIEILTTEFGVQDYEDFRSIFFNLGSANRQE